jgi:hypothetical protein
LFGETGFEPAALVLNMYRNAMEKASVMLPQERAKLYSVEAEG